MWRGSNERAAPTRKRPYASFAPETVWSVSTKLLEEFKFRLECGPASVAACREQSVHEGRAAAVEVVNAASAMIRAFGAEDFANDFVAIRQSVTQRFKRLRRLTIYVTVTRFDFKDPHKLSRIRFALVRPRHV
jgi:hypothetical protein